MKRIPAIALLLTLIAVLVGCAKASVNSGNNNDASPDTDSDSDTDTDSDVDADSDADSDSDSDCSVNLLESFDVEGPPSGWEIENFDGDAYGYVWSWSETGNTTGGSGGFWWVNGAFNANFDDRLITSDYIRGDCTNVHLTFNHSYSDNGVDDFGYLEIEVDSGSWVALDTFDSTVDGAEDFDISSYLPSADSQFRIRFRYVGFNDLSWKIDDFELSATP